jgi:tetratricopeptide (TPR) repeat protein
MKRHLLLLIIIFFAAVSKTYAQSKTIDSLKNLLRNESEDSSRCLALAKLSREYLYFKTDTALLLAEQGLVISRKIHFPKGEARCLNCVANALSQIGNNSQALEFLIEVLKLSETIEDYQMVTMALGNIGIIYDGQKDYRKALKYYFESKAMAVRIGSEYSITANLINLGYTYEKLNQLDSARFYTNQAFEIAIKEKNSEFLSAILISLGNIYAKMQQNEVAISNYKQGFVYASAANFNEGICEASLGLAEALKNQKSGDSSLHYGRLSLFVAQKNGFIQWILNSSNFLAEYYKKDDLVDSAYVYLSISIAAKDSLFNQEKNQQIQNLSINETFRQQQIEAQKVEQAKEHSDNMQYAFMAMGLATFIIIFLLLTHNIIINEKWIHFLGVLGLLLLFEFLNLFLHPYISKITHHSPLLMLFVLVAIAALLIPQHHRIEKWIIEKMVARNKLLRNKTAQKVVLEAKEI